MVSLIAKWRSMTGRRYTSPTDVASVDVEAYANPNPATEGGIQKVVFTVADSDGGTSVFEVLSRSYRFPDFSQYTSSPLPGVTTQMASVWGYGITIDMDSYAPGPIRVTARAYAASGDYFDLPDRITIFNDSDGGDRRPSTKQIYVNPTGSDSNPGTVGSPVRTIQKAITLCRKNTAGSSIDDADCGGAIIYLSDGHHAWGGVPYYDATQWVTSDDWWLQIVSVSGNATISNVPQAVTGSLYPDSYVFARGYNGGGTCRIQVSNCKFLNRGGAVRVGDGSENSQVLPIVWIDGGESYSTGYRVTDHTVRYKEYSGEIVGIEYNKGRRYVTGHNRHHVENGWHGWTLVMDCWLHQYTGIALQAIGSGHDACNLLIEDQHTYNNAGGTITDGYAWVVDGAKLVVSKPSASTMRVTCVGVPTSIGGSTTSSGFASSFAALTGSVIIGVGFKRFPSSANNGVFRYLASGTDGNGNEYVEVANANAVPQAGVGGGSSSRTEMFTGRITDQMQYNDILHADILQWLFNCSNTLHSNISVANVRESQAWYASNYSTQNNNWVVNITDGGMGIITNFANVRMTDCGFIGSTFTGTADFNGGPGYINNCFVDCVFQRSGALPFATSYVRNCHWVDTSSYGADVAGGISPSSGSWFAGATNVNPYSMTPASGNLNTASNILGYSEIDWLFNTAVSTSKGAWRNTAEHDWQSVSAPGASIPVVAQAGVQNLTWTINAASFNRGVNTSSQTITTGLFTQQGVVDNNVYATHTPITLSLAANNQIANTAVYATYEMTDDFFLGIVYGSATPGVSVVVVSGVLTLNLSQYSASVLREVVGTYQIDFADPIRVEPFDQTAITLSPVLAGVVTLSITANNQTILKEIIAQAAVQTLTITQIPTVDEIIVATESLSLGISQLSATASATVVATNSPITLSLSTPAQGFALGVLPSVQTLTLSQIPSDTQGYVYAESGAPLVLSLVQHSAYEDGNGPINFRLIQPSAVVGIATSAFHYPQWVEVMALDQSVGVEVLAAYNRPPVLQFIAQSVETATSATFTNSLLYLGLTILDQTVKSGTIVVPSTLSVSISPVQQNVGTSEVATHFPNFLVVEALDAYVVMTAVVENTTQNISITQNNCEAVVEVVGTYDTPVAVSTVVGSAYASASYSHPVLAEIPQGSTRDTLNQEIFWDPVIKEIWRIVQDE